MDVQSAIEPQQPVGIYRYAGSTREQPDLPKFQVHEETTLRQQSQTPIEIPNGSAHT